MNTVSPRLTVPLLACSLALVLLLGGCVNMAQRGAISRAYRAYNNKEYVTALRHLSRADRYDRAMTADQQAELLYLKGRCLEGLGNGQEARLLYEHISVTWPGSEYGARARGRMEEF